MSKAEYFNISGEQILRMSIMNPLGHIRRARATVQTDRRPFCVKQRYIRREYRSVASSTAVTNRFRPVITSQKHSGNYMYHLL
jgi:hypothetical protein